MGFCLIKLIHVFRISLSLSHSLYPTLSTSKPNLKPNPKTNPRFAVIVTAKYLSGRRFHLVYLCA
jgi:hypothetical protein